MGLISSIRELFSGKYGKLVFVGLLVFMILGLLVLLFILISLAVLFA